MKNLQLTIGYLALIGLLSLSLSYQLADASQGCPFDDGSCQEYCGQQGCSLGYCGHFAWIQCICRKCGDEWSWYDKVRYNPDKTVNQTELDSLKLNGTSPLVLSGGSGTSQTIAQKQEQQVTGSQAAKQQPPKQQTATLTTLLIPDLSDSKLDLNDIPEENSDKFLDYLAKNRDKLVQLAAAKEDSAGSSSRQQQSGGDEELDLTATEGGQQATNLATSTQLPEERLEDSETIEIQISSSNNNNSITIPATTTTTTSSTTAATVGKPLPSTTTQPEVVSSSRQQQSPVTRLLRMAVVERDSQDID